MDSNCCLEAVSYAAVGEDSPSGLVIDVILLHGCPQSCMPDPVEGLLEVYEDMMEVLLMLETVTSFKYLGSVITDEGSKAEILSRIAQTTAALTGLKLIWSDGSTSLNSKIRLMLSLVTSIFAVCS